MPYSSGTFSRVHDFTDDRDNGIRIQASRMDAEMDGIATGLSTALLKDGTQTATAKIPFAVGLSVIDNQTILLGTNSDIAIQYDETTNDSLEISANVEGAALGIVLKSDQGDDNADQHKLSIADGGTLTLGSKISGSFVSYLTHTPNSTVASSTLAVAGNLTVGGNLTLGSGAELSEAELEMLDGITAGTVAASKAVVVDANKDIASFRNVTLTGELDAATGDFSGDVDVDGTLEADAITVNGTALATVIAGTTVTTATNANHVSVADNESTNEENLIPFIEDASATGNVGLESDGDFAYNPSTGTVSATVFKGNIDAVDGDFDGTLEADAMTLNGTAITATATLDTGISNNNVPKFTSGVADDDFLRVNGTAIEGRSASEVLSDIGGQASLTFGISNTNAVKIDSSSVADDEYARFTANGLESRSTSEVLSDIGGQAALTFGISDTNIPIFTSGVADDNFLRVNGTSIEGRTATDVLIDIGGSPVAGSSSIVTTGALNAGSITSGFGTIDTGSSNITSTGVGAFGSLDISGDIDVDGTTNLDVVDIDGAVDMASTLQVDGAITSSSGMTITTADNTDTLTLTSTDADANSGSNLRLYRNSSSPAQNDLLGNIQWEGRNNNSQDVIYAEMRSQIETTTDGSEDANFKWSTMISGTLVDRLAVNANATVFNDDSVDVDFRVEGNGDANALFVEGETDNVGIGNNDPADKLHVYLASGQRVARFEANSSTSAHISFKANNTSLMPTVGVKDEALYFSTGDAVERMRIGSGGNVDIGSTNFLFSGQLRVNDGSVFRSNDYYNGKGVITLYSGVDTNLGIYVDINNSAGNRIGAIKRNGTSGVSFNTSSDYRLKESVTYDFDATTRLKQLKPCRFNFIGDEDTIDGFLAHEVSSIVPNAISGEKNEVDANGNAIHQQIDPTKMIGLLVKTIQELEARITTLEGN